MFERKGRKPCTLLFPDKQKTRSNHPSYAEYPTRATTAVFLYFAERAFAEFAASELPQRLHEALTRQSRQGQPIGHIARDSTAIEARERYPENPPPKVARQKYKRGPKPKRSTPRSQRSRSEAQRGRAVLDMLAELPRHCSLRVQKSSKGYQQYWRGFKLHLDVADGQIPITALLTGAWLHDSQVAIPGRTLSSERVTHLYELMDKAYDAHAIRAHSEALGHRGLTELPQRHRRVSVKVPLSSPSCGKPLPFCKSFTNKENIFAT